MTAPVVTVYTYAESACPQCDATKKTLDRLGVAYAEEAITDDVRLAAAELGITSAPIVCASMDGWEMSWGGFRPERLNELARAS